MRITHFLSILVVLLSTTIHAQAPVDIGLRSSGDRLEVLLRPGADFQGIVSSLVFTLRWQPSTGATLGAIAQEGAPAEYLPVQPSGTVRNEGAYHYQVFAGFGTRPLHTLNAAWKAGMEVVIASIPVSGAGEFELVNDAWTAVPTHNADFYLSLGGVDRTGTIYKSLAIAEGDGALSIQPNPNNGQFTISVEVAKAQDLALEVMDPQGKVVYEQALNGFAGTYRRDLDLSGMSAGVYLLKLKRGDQRSTHKVVVY